MFLTTMDVFSLLNALLIVAQSFPSLQNSTLRNCTYESNCASGLRQTGDVEDMAPREVLTTGICLGTCFSPHRKTSEMGLLDQDTS